MMPVLSGATPSATSAANHSVATGFTRTYTARSGCVARQFGADRPGVLAGRRLAVGRHRVLEVEGDAVGCAAWHLAQHVGLARRCEQQAAEASGRGVHGCFVHQRVPAGAAHELVALVVAAVLERDDALRGPRLRLPRRDDLRLAVQRVTHEHRGREHHLVEPEVGDGRAVRRLEHRDPDQEPEGEEAVDERLTELGARGVLGVEVEARRVHGHRA